MFGRRNPVLLKLVSNTKITRRPLAAPATETLPDRSPTAEMLDLATTIGNGSHTTKKRRRYVVPGIEAPSLLKSSSSGRGAGGKQKKNSSTTSHSQNENLRNLSSNTTHSRNRTFLAHSSEENNSNGKRSKIGTQLPAASLPSSTATSSDSKLSQTNRQPQLHDDPQQHQKTDPAQPSSEPGVSPTTDFAGERRGGEKKRSDTSDVALNTNSCHTPEKINGSQESEVMQQKTRPKGKSYRKNNKKGVEPGIGEQLIAAFLRDHHSVEKEVARRMLLDAAVKCQAQIRLNNIRSRYASLTDRDQAKAEIYNQLLDKYPEGVPVEILARVWRMSRKQLRSFVKEKKSGNHKLQQVIATLDKIDARKQAYLELLSENSDGVSKMKLAQAWGLERAKIIEYAELHNIELKFIDELEERKMLYEEVLRRNDGIVTRNDLRVVWGISHSATGHYLKKHAELFPNVVFATDINFLEVRKAYDTLCEKYPDKKYISIRELRQACSSGISTNVVQCVVSRSEPDMFSRVHMSWPASVDLNIDRF